MKNHIIFFSGGKSSFAAAEYVKVHYPNDNILLYFNDTLWENKDLYRFNNEVSDKLKLPMLIHSAGLTPIQLMFEKKLVFNSMIGDCSKILKMKVARDFLKKGERPEIEKWRNREYLKHDDFTTDATLYFGIGFDEMHRENAIRKNWQPFKVEMPLIENNIDPNEIMKKYNIRQPELYDYGFSHNNCNGRCVKAGQGHYKRLKEQMPDVFEKIVEQEHHIKICVSAYRYITDEKIPEDERIPKEAQEIMLQELDDAYRDYFYDCADKPKPYVHPAGGAIGKYMEIQQYSFMKKSEKNESRPYPLAEFGRDHRNDPRQIDMFDIGGCGCFVEGLEACEVP